MPINYLQNLCFLISSIQTSSSLQMSLSWGVIQANKLQDVLFASSSKFSECFPSLQCQTHNLLCLLHPLNHVPSHQEKNTSAYTDSQYAFNVCHSTGQIWNHWGFITSSGVCFSHCPLMLELLYAIALATTISVMHCSSHIGTSDEVSLGNAYTHAVAKQVAPENSPATF